MEEEVIQNAHKTNNSRVLDRLFVIKERNKEVAVDYGGRRVESF